MGTLDPTLNPIYPSKYLDMYPIWDCLLPSDEVFLESLIQYDLLLDVGSVVTNSNPDLPSKPKFSSYVGLVESLDSSFEQQVIDLDEFDFFMNFSIPIILSLFLQNLSPLLIFALLLRLILLIVNPQALVL